MEPIVTDVTPETLFAASYEHVVAYIRHCAHAPRGEFVETPELTWGICGALNPFMNGVVRTQLAPATPVDRTIESVLDHARRRAVPFAWFVMPGSSPADLSERLAAHGLKHDGNDPGMAIDLETLPAANHTPPGVNIVEVLDFPTLEQWVDVWGDAYGAGAARRRSRLEFRARQGLGPHTPYRPYLAYLEGRPVATSELFLGAGVAAVVWVGVAPAARRQGIGAAITLAPLLEARRLGYRIGALTASEDGYPVYLRLGFQEMCRIPTYFWQPPE